MRTTYGPILTTSALLGFAACSKANNTPKETATSSAVTSESSPMGNSATTSSGGSSGQTPPYNPCGKSANGAPGITAPSDLFSPPGLPNVGLSETAALKVHTSTLKTGAKGLELYVGVCNGSDWFQCSPAMQVELYDATDQVIGTVSGSVQSGRLFRLSESPYPTSCVAPGELGMAAITAFPEGIVLESVKSLGYRFSTFQFEATVPLTGARVSQVEAFATSEGSAFRGTVTNDSDSPVTNPSVSVFPITEGGRPLGYATTSAVLEIPPGGNWSFETSAVAERGVGQVTFAIANPPAEP
jgi:hypothetical protein